MFTDFSDFNEGIMSINVSARVMSQFFMININDDNIVECIKSFSITIVSASICTVAVGINNNSEMIITDNDGM